MSVDEAKKQLESAKSLLATHGVYLEGQYSKKYYIVLRLFQSHFENGPFSSPPVVVSTLCNTLCWLEIHI